MAKPSPWLNYLIRRALDQIKKPRRSGVPTGASRLRSVCGGNAPTPRWYYNVAAYNVSWPSLCNAKRANQKDSPERGLTARGHAGSVDSSRVN